MEICLENDVVILTKIDKSEEAIKKYVKWMNDKSFNHFIGHNQIFQNLEDERNWAENSYKDGKWSFNIRDKETGNLIGNCEICVKDIYSARYCLGICIGEHDYHSKHFGRNALMLLIQFAFEELNANSIELEVREDNLRAIKCYKACGFKEVGRRRQHKFYKGNYHDSIMMDMLKSEYF